MGALRVSDQRGSQQFPLAASGLPDFLFDLRYIVDPEFLLEGVQLLKEFTRCSVAMATSNWVTEVA
jgi:hypothetical protein